MFFWLHWYFALSSFHTQVRSRKQVGSEIERLKSRTCSGTERCDCSWARQFWLRAVCFRRFFRLLSTEPLELQILTEGLSAISFGTERCDRQFLILLGRHRCSFRHVCPTDPNPGAARHVYTQAHSFKSTVVSEFQLGNGSTPCFCLSVGCRFAHWQCHFSLATFSIHTSSNQDWICKYEWHCILLLAIPTCWCASPSKTCWLMLLIRNVHKCREQHPITVAYPTDIIPEKVQFNRTPELSSYESALAIQTDTSLLATLISF